MQDSTKVTWGQVYQDFKGALSGAADALKTGSEHVYEVLVRQQVVNSISWILLYIVMTLITYVVWRVVTEIISDDDEFSPLYILPSLLVIATVATIMCTMSDTITGFVNPEYGAIQEIRKFIR